MQNFQRKIAVIGLGYVGLPVAIAMAEKFDVIAYDKNPQRVAELNQGHDKTGEISDAQLQRSTVKITTDPNLLSTADFYIITVPTPIDASKRPDLSFLLNASRLVARYLKKGDIVVYESTVYPGATEQDCLPVLEQHSGLTAGVDFKIGYSPERVNPGDKKHTFTQITKVVSGQDAESLDIIAHVYGAVVEAGIYRAENIKTAEAAKIIENTQRDVNIALINELAIIFNHMGIDTQSVLAAAETKWNFLNFKPGLVGGHCIGVDPYYLTYQAERYGYKPEVILAGRRINDHVGKYIAQQTIKKMIHAGYTINNARVGILGITFKENCPDIRNSKVIDIINELNEYGVECLVHDPHAESVDVREQYGFDLVSWSELKNLDTFIMAVAHEAFKRYPLAEYHKKLRHHSILIDVKGVFNAHECAQAGIDLWRL
ncbi:MAG: GDP-mannose dehydrogenase [Coxiella sp. RIFCSPHIGHO2_12_FULL_44_14]|nr:MAG: GDP-mannose dehydrogenase [Coxiella sp. RIFCSPHIGHO2_12_FULL_44_14]